MLNKKPLLCAAVSAIGLFFLPIIFFLLGIFFLSEFFAFLSNLAILIASVYFLYGFYYLGIKYKSQLLRVLGVIGIVFVIVSYFSLFIWSGQIENSVNELNQTISQKQIVLDNLNVTNASAEQIAEVQSSMDKSLLEFVKPFAIIGLILVGMLFVYAILFNIALVRLKKVKYARATGIVGLVSMGLFISIFGIFLAIPLAIAYYIMLVVVLFNQAQKFKEIR